jgi:formate dehydrogenase assembly factor FdhD
VSGRLSFELVQKLARTVSRRRCRAPSSLAIELGATVA